MRFVVKVMPVFAAWFDEQDHDLVRAITMHVALLKEQGPHLGRPYADTVKGSHVPNLKELRVQHRGQPFRILFAFDPIRQAVLLVGGRKRDDRRWYRAMIRVAERQYEEHLDRLRKGDGDDDG